MRGCGAIGWEGKTEKCDVRAKQWLDTKWPRACWHFGVTEYVHVCMLLFVGFCLHVSVCLCGKHTMTFPVSARSALTKGTKSVGCAQPLQSHSSAASLSLVGFSFPALWGFPVWQSSSGRVLYGPSSCPPEVPFSLGPV